MRSKDSMPLESEKPRRREFHDYGILVDDPTRCPRCGAHELTISARRFYCKGCAFRADLDEAEIQDAEAVAPAILTWHEIGPPKGMSYGWPEVDSYVRAVRGEWTLLTGWPQHGKTTFSQAFQINMAAKGWRFAVFSPENAYMEDPIRGLVEKFLGKRFRGTDGATREEVILAMKWLKKHFFFIRPKNPTFENVIAAFSQVVRDHKVEGCLIDPWNELEHEVPFGMNETLYTGRVLRRWSEFCREQHVHGWIVAHPAKQRDAQAKSKNSDGVDARPVVRLTDVSGSQNFENKAYNGLSFWRDATAIDEADRNACHLYILKGRTRGVARVGKVVLSWDSATTAFHGPQKFLSPDSFPGNAVKAKLDAEHAEGWKGIVTKLDPEGWWRYDRFLKWESHGQGVVSELKYGLRGWVTKIDQRWGASVRKNVSVDLILQTQGQAIMDGEAAAQDFATKEEAIQFCEAEIIDRDPARVAFN